MRRHQCRLDASLRWHDVLGAWIAASELRAGDFPLGLRRLLEQLEDGGGAAVALGIVDRGIAGDAVGMLGVRAAAVLKLLEEPAKPEREVAGPKL